MLGLENLRRDTEADVAGLLDSAVDVNVAVIDDEHEEARRLLVAIASLIPDLCDYGESVRSHCELRERDLPSSPPSERLPGPIQGFLPCCGWASMKPPWLS